MSSWTSLIYTPDQKYLRGIRQTVQKEASPNTSEKKDDSEYNNKNVYRVTIHKTIFGTVSKEIFAEAEHLGPLRAAL